MNFIYLAFHWFPCSLIDGFSGLLDPQVSVITLEHPPFQEELLWSDCDPMICIWWSSFPSSLPTLLLLLLFDLKHQQSHLHIFQLASAIHLMHYWFDSQFISWINWININFVTNNFVWIEIEKLVWSSKCFDKQCHPTSFCSLHY